ncbi:MAG: tRNA 2-thiouridine(34) synthase MnmA [Patescibacteria group bacterium]
MNKGKRVFVGMSGGVDSSVSAALLKDAGYDVTGVFIKVWHPDWLPCEWKEERRDAMRVAAHLNIPFLTIDLEQEYKKSVADYMIEEYRKGRTPNPDVMCNKEIKFGSFLQKALEMGADYIATGHYAQISNAILKEGADQNKDQSYFLWTLTDKQLKHVLFPVGHLTKPEVRKLAEKYKLPTATKKDSQGICFIGKVDMREFLSHYISPIPGNVVNEKGEIIGNHEGALFYTIGQRHGFIVTEKTPHDKPYYIVDKNTDANTLTVSQKFSEHDLKTVYSVGLTDVNWNQNFAIDISKKYSARIRYRQDPQECMISNNEIIFSMPQQGVSVGQSVVVYDGDLCFGGGIINTVKL